MDYIFVGLGGSIGAMARYGLSKWVGTRWRGEFPLGTFIINTSGALALGFLAVLFSVSGPEKVWLNKLVTTGMLGAFTTYSTFSFEIIDLIRGGEIRTGAVYLAASVFTGLVAAYFGIILARLLLGQ